MTKLLLMFIAIITLVGCSQEQTVVPASQAMVAEKKEETTKTNLTSPEHLLVFFINPTGGPCVMQEKILADMASELEGKVIIRPVKTTVPDDMNIFYAYGIRGLPSMILTDSEGKEIKRLPPGVHSADTIRILLNYIPEN